MLAAVLLSLATSSAASGSVYYKLYDRTFTIDENRLLEMSETVTLYNTGPQTIGGLSWTVPSSSIEGLYAWDDQGELKYDNGDPMYSANLVGSNTKIEINFRSPGLRPNNELTFYVSYRAGGLVSGSGIEYRAGLGGVDAGDFRYDNYIIKIRGPSGSSFFASDPQAELVENDPPMIRYTTSIQAHDNFEGIRVRFYKQPAFYKVTMNFPFTNHGQSQSTDLSLDAILFSGEAPWQFSALISSSHQIQTMYVDEENNWHGVFNISQLAPGQTQTITLELLYEVQLYNPGISAADVGPISEVPASLQGYLKQDDKWESESAAIGQAAATAVTGGASANVYLAAENISNYVVSRLDYQIQADRKGALWAYSIGEGDCSEYTDLAIALARAAGVPARAMYGWGYYEQENLRGHAWLEYYFPGVGWLPADPTWDETFKAYFAKLDPIHLTRNVRGLSSSESGASYIYYGGSVTLHENEVTITPLERAGAAQEFVDAAEYAVNLADRLLAASPDQTLQSKQNSAKQYLAQAQAASDENQKILYAKNSLQNADEVIAALGTKPSQQTPVSIALEKLLPFLVAAGVVVVVGLVAYVAIRRRRRHEDF